MLEPNLPITKQSAATNPGEISRAHVRKIGEIHRICNYIILSTTTYLHPSTASHIDCSPGAPAVSHSGSHSPPPAGVTDQARKP